MPATLDRDDVLREITHLQAVADRLIESHQRYCPECDTIRSYADDRSTYCHCDNDE